MEEIVNVDSIRVIREKFDIISAASNNRFMWRIVLMIGLFLGTAVQAEDVCKDANDLGKQKKYAEALKSYRITLSKFPKDQDCLYNAGLTAYLGKDFPTAIEMWKELKKLDSEDWQVRSKLIQAFQAAGKLKERDAERIELLQLHKTGTDAQFLKQPQYCRDQFEVDGRHVLAYEFFELKGDFAQRYKFIVSKKESEQPDFAISLGSYKETNAYALESGQIKAGERLFHLDGYYDGDQVHKTFGFYTTEPSYDEVRKAVMAAIQGKTPVASSSKKQ